MKKPPVIEIAALTKQYGALRPLRLDAFTLRAGQSAALTGLDAPASEILVNVLTGATLPDTGEVRLFGRPTSAIVDADDWLATLDRIGMVSIRALLLHDLTVAQAVAMSFTLSLDPVPEAVRIEVARLSAEVGLGDDVVGLRLAEVAPLVKARVHLARALASAPEVLLLEHPMALLAEDTPEAATILAGDVTRIARARGVAILVLSAHDVFARLVSDRVYKLDAATGRLRNRSGLLRYFS
jgi:ABC-type transporter Mla maintaining outer membrane lipid asymmetry ATPase subunit MlaF